MIRSVTACTILICLVSPLGCTWHRKAKLLPPPPLIPAYPSAPAGPPAASTKSPGPRTSPASRATPAMPRPHVSPTPAPEPAQAASSARLSEILSPERKAELSNSLNHSLAIANKVLTRIQTHSLTPDQSDKAGLVRMFATRAEAARESDLAVAALLAKRAQLLAESLAASIY